MKRSIEATWTGKLSFESEVNGHNIKIDGASGDSAGARPKSLMMVSLAGCTGIDVASILEKMRVNIDALNIKVEGELAEEVPQPFTKMHVIYEFKGKDLPMAKLERAVKLSQDEYCGVSETLKPTVEITYDIKILE